MSKEMQLVIAEERRDAEAIGRIQGLIEAMRDDGKSDQEIYDRLVQKYEVSDKDAEVALTPAV